MIPEMIRAGELSQRLFAFKNQLSPRPPADPAMVEEALTVIKDLMDEVTRLQNRADHACRKADELVGWLNGRWG